MLPLLANLFIHSGDGFILWGWRQRTYGRRMHFSRLVPWKRSLNSHGSLCWAVPCLARLGWASSALVLMLCSSLQGSGKVQAAPQLHQFIVNACRLEHTYTPQKNQTLGQTQVHVHLTVTPSACLCLSKVTSRSLSSLTHHWDTRQRLLLNFGKAFCLRFFLFCYFNSSTHVVGCT